jgi:hypothetical protein
LSELREKPAGTIRITSTEYAADAILTPALAKILPKYPDIKVEVVIDYGLTNIVAEQYDAGIRPGELVAKDMIAVRVGPDLRMDPAGDEIVELAMIAFDYVVDGSLLNIVGPFDQMRDPGRPIPAEVSRLTGLSSASFLCH